MNRRDILCSLPALAITGGMAGAGGLAGGPGPTADSAAEIGRWLISHRVMPSDRAALMAGLGVTRICAAARRAVEADFGAGRIVPVDGWFISETEARLCALAALDEDCTAPA